MNKKTVEEMLKGAAKKDYIEIISKMSNHSKSAEQVIVDWCKKNNAEYKTKAVEIELRNLWKRAYAIIDQFNAYGGGPRREEKEACDNLWKMDELVKEHDIPWDTRVEILDEMLEQFRIGNSGFDDLLIDVASTFCKSKEEQRYLADQLSTGSRGYYADYAARIYESIGDEEQFLKTKLNNLQYGSDYIDAAEYFAEKGDREQEMYYIWQGLEKCNGRLDELIDYAAPIYIKERNDVQLRKIYELALKTKWDLNIAAIAKHLFDYCKIIKNDTEKKKILMLILDTCTKDELRDWYSVCKDELSSEEWDKQYAEILEKVKKKDVKFYLDICMETGEEEIVLNYLQSQNHSYDYWDVDYEQYFSKRLSIKYPDEILDLYWQKVNQYLGYSNNKNYQSAAAMLGEIKSLMKKIKREKEWEKQFAELIEKHRRKKNFMALLGGLR